MKKWLVLALFVAGMVSCSKEKDITTVEDVLASVGAELTETEKLLQENNTEQVTYHFRKKCATTNDTRQLLRKIVATINHIADGNPVETQTLDSPSVYYYVWRSGYELHFTFEDNVQMLSGYIIEWRPARE